MAMKHYSEEFKAAAVALYLSDPSRTYASVAKDLGANQETLRLWVRQALTWRMPGRTASYGNVYIPGGRLDDLGRALGARVER